MLPRNLLTNQLDNFTKIISAELNELQTNAFLLKRFD